MHIDQIKAKNAGVNLDADAVGGGYTKDVNTKRSDKVCPRCRGKHVSKFHRKCLDCGGRLLWDGDDANLANRMYEYWYMWHKNVWGIEGWYAQDYWNLKSTEMKY
jgi:hypothetical protein